MSGFPVSHWGGLAIPPAFDGLDQSLNRLFGLTNLPTNGRRGILYLSLRTSGGTPFHVGGVKVFPMSPMSGKFRMGFEARNTSGGLSINATQLSALYDGGEWGNFLFAWDVDQFASADRLRIYINDVDDTLTVIEFDGGPDLGYDGSSNRIATDKDDSDFLDGCLEKVYFNTKDWLDLTDVNNRRKFYDSDGKPVNMEKDGSGPTGNQPSVFMRGNRSVFPTNFGDGGGFILINGPLASCSTNPTKNPPD